MLLDMDARPAFLVVALAGCGGPELFQPGGRCNPDGIGLYLVEDERDCRCLNAQADDAVAVVRELVPEADLSGVTVWVRSRAGRLDGGDHPLGRYIPGGDVEQERYASTLAHELLHHVEMTQHGKSAEQAAAHDGWRELGWLAAGQRYQNRIAGSAPCR